MTQQKVVITKESSTINDYLKDGWTIGTRDGKPSAHFGQNVAIIDGKPELLSTFAYVYKALGIVSDEENEFRREPFVV